METHRVLELERRVKRRKIKDKVKSLKTKKIISLWKRNKKH